MRPDLKKPDDFELLRFFKELRYEEDSKVKHNSSLQTNQYFSINLP